MAKKPEIKRTLSNLNTRTGVKKQYHFEYWADSLDWDVWGEDVDQEDRSENYLQKVMQLSALRRAATNFVRILTGDERIGVVYSTGKDSYTDGRTVVISAEPNPAKFDKTVAVALHEAAHCKLTDFVFANLAFKEYPAAFQPHALHVGANKAYPGLEGDRWALTAQIAKDLSLIVNVLEDRRIDDYVYNTAVGYRPYYDVLYQEYWNSKEVSKALKTIWTNPCMDSYMNRIINISNPAAWESRHLLEGMDEIYTLMDLPNIRRFNTETYRYDKFTRTATRYTRGSGRSEYQQPSLDAVPEDWRVPTAGMLEIREECHPAIYRTACAILAVIYRHVVESGDQPDEAEEGQPSDMAGNGDAETDSAAPGESDDSNLDLGSGPTSQPSKTGKRQEKPLNEKKLEKELDKIRKFLEGETKKKKIDRKIREEVEAMAEAESKLHRVGNDKLGHGRVLVTEQVSEAIMASNWWAFSRPGYGVNGSNLQRYWTADKMLAAGIRRGQILAHRLAVRNEQTITTFPNQRRGGIDRRALAKLGMDIETVFNRKQLDAFRPALIHLSLDGSGSMSGERWERAFETATALLYAAHKISNLEMVISIRGQVRSDDRMAHMAIIHDSRQHSFVHWRHLGPFLHPSGGTPEGLCFEAIMDDILKAANEYQVYFVNISDGEPSFECSPVAAPKRTRRRYYYTPQPQDPSEKSIYYAEALAWQHTRQQVNKMREVGIRVLSYFVGGRSMWRPGHLDSIDTGSKKAFRIMYGEDASFVNVEQLSSIITTMNKLLLKRGS